MTIKEYLAIGKLVAILLLIAWAARINDLRARWQHQYQSEHAGRLADRQSYVNAQAQATITQNVQVAKVQQEYQRNSDNEKSAYARDRAELLRLRAQRAAAPKGSPSAANPSPDSATGPKPNGDGVQVSPADALQKARDDGADIELRLEHLQLYVDGLLSIDPNK